MVLSGGVCGDTDLFLAEDDLREALDDREVVKAISSVDELRNKGKHVYEAFMLVMIKYVGI